MGVVSTPVFYEYITPNINKIEINLQSEQPIEQGSPTFSAHVLFGLGVPLANDVLDFKQVNKLKQYYFLFNK